jgi:hypothetical protein
MTQDFRSCPDSEGLGSSGHGNINQVNAGFFIAMFRSKYGSPEAGSPYEQDWSKRAITSETSSDVA